MQLMVVSFAAVMALALSVQAAAESIRWYANPQIGYVWADADREVGNAVSYGLSVGWDVDPTFCIELSGIRGSHSGAARELDVSALSLDALRVFRRSAPVSPYLTVGAGYFWKDWRDGRHDRGPLAQAGLGLLIDLAESRSGSFVLQLRPEAHVRWDFFGERPRRGYLDYAAGIGLQVTFGARRDATAMRP